MTLRILVMEGNDAEGRERQKLRLGRMASEGYSRCIKALAPDAAIDICLPADEDADLPDVHRLRDYDGVFITGSALHIWEGKPQAMRQVAFARKVYESGVPFFGSCWGLQVATAAAGGEIGKNPLGREAGIARAITVNAVGRSHPLLAGRPEVFDTLCFHLDNVLTPAPGTVVLASNAMSDVQAAEISYRGGVFWGVQYHPEFSLAHVANIFAANFPVHIEEGRFATEEAGQAYCGDLRTVCADPSRRDIAERYGLGPDLLSGDIRATEIRNFIQHRARAHARMRLAA